jgi:hypothetical protein
MSTLNSGYAWMGLNVFCTASYVLGMRKVIKKMNFKDWDSKCRVRASGVWRPIAKKTDADFGNNYSHVLQ